MARASAFWSYVHRDDDAESGRVSQLARDLARQYEMITAEPISIFVDRRDLTWGDHWRTAIDTSLASVTFFVPIVTPRYFQSDECRRELNTFARRASQLGVRELVMPILYIEVPALRLDPATDDLMALANSFQAEDWTRLRFAAADSTEYRTAVARMAERLAEATLAVEQIEVVVPELAPEVDVVDDDAPGFLDRVLQAEAAMFEWAETLTQVGGRMQEVNAASEIAAARIKESDARGDGVAGRLRIFGELADDLAKPAESILELSNSFTAQMNDVDVGIRAILLKAHEELRAPDPDADLAVQTATFVGQLRELTEAAEIGLGMLDTLITMIGSVEDQSRNLRPVFRKMRRGLAVLVDAKAVMLGWVTLVDELGLPTENEPVGIAPAGDGATG